MAKVAMLPESVVPCRSGGVKTRSGVVLPACCSTGRVVSGADVVTSIGMTSSVVASMGVVPAIAGSSVYRDAVKRGRQ